jgi:D-glycero-D-manno-heptose 1,7-bisphosphate phosphatase
VKRYVQSWDEFEFLPGVLEAIPVLNKIFARTVVVTNQRGIGLGLMSLEELEKIHQRLISEVASKDGHIDKIYFCDKQMDEKPNCRKPEPFMALQAQKDFPEIDFTSSFMVGDQASDILFGASLGMTTVWIPNEAGMRWKEKAFAPDHIFPGLKEFADHMRS